MTNQVIPEAAVEAAARAFWNESPISRRYNTWEYLKADVGYKDDFRRAARAALEAAAAHMLAEAWDEGMQAMYDTTSSEWPPIPEANPYR